MPEAASQMFSRSVRQHRGIDGAEHSAILSDVMAGYRHDRHRTVSWSARCTRDMSPS
jgi:hypothetical protein